MVSALVAELATEAMSKLTDRSLHSVVGTEMAGESQNRDWRQHVFGDFAARGGRTWNLMQRLDTRVSTRMVQTQVSALANP